jgi:hypothetical protein
MTEDNTPKLYCYNHPNRETLLRCNNCNRPICPDCAVLTETGYRCKECVRGQQKVFETAQAIDYPIAFVIAVVLGYLGGRLTSVLGFFILFAAPIAGVVIAEAVRWATRRHRSRWLYRTAAIGALLGAIWTPLMYLLLAVLSGGSLGALGAILWQAAYVILMVPSFYYRLSGIQIG